MKCKTGIRDNAATRHRIENKVSLPSKIIECVADQLGRNPPWPVIPKTLIHIIEIQ
jgi:hypothetical protein